jgi:hypothetical protein
MRLQTDPSRRCLPVREWPQADRMAWHTVTTDDPLSIERSTASRWRPATHHKNRRGYGRWLTFLDTAGADLGAPPTDRVTRERITAYLAELRRQQVAPFTLRNRILELLAVMLAFAPTRDWSWLKSCGIYLDRKAEENLDRSPPPLLAADIISRAMNELRHRLQTTASGRVAVEYRNWLMLTILAILPLRLRNFAALGSIVTWNGAMGPGGSILPAARPKQAGLMRHSFRLTPGTSSTITCPISARASPKEAGPTTYGSLSGDLRLPNTRSM